MKTFSPLSVLATLGALVLTAGTAAAAPDTSKWKCETCPFEKDGASGTIDVGVDAISDKSAKFAEYSRLDREGASPVLGIDARWRGGDGLWGTLRSSYDTGRLDAAVGREGSFALKLGFLDIPHHVSDTTQTPFLGVGGSVLTLPAGFPAPSTGAMPLAATLQPIELGTNRRRLDVGAVWFASPGWTHRLSARQEVRDGLQHVAGSFFSTASQMVAPLDQTTDVVELSSAYVTSTWQASLAYQVSKFKNDEPSLTWANPFTPVVPGGDKGQLALAPDNTFRQLVATGAYVISPQWRASADVAIGSLTQDDSFVPATLNPLLAGSAALPRASLDGKVETFNGSVRVTGTPMPQLRVRAAYMHDERENKTRMNAYPALITDLFFDPTLRANIPFSHKQDRVKLEADYRGPAALRTSGGIEYDNMHRSYSEVVNTSETTLWGRLSGKVHEKVSLAAKLSFGDRNNDGYGSATWASAPQNPLMRKFNLADRKRGLADLRADFALTETLGFGLRAEYANDDYSDSAIGLTDSRTTGLGGDLSAALTDDTRLNLYAQFEKIRSRLAGSETFSTPDWSASLDDRIDTLGVGLKHTAMSGKLELGADYVYSRSRSDTAFATAAPSTGLPTHSGELSSLKLTATYRLKDNLSLTAGYWYQQYKERNWALDGVTPATVPNLLSMGAQAPNDTVNVLRVAAKYSF